MIGKKLYEYNVLFYTNNFKPSFGFDIEELLEY